MKRALVLSLIAVLLMALVPTAAAEEGELGTTFSEAAWIISCDEASSIGSDFAMGMVRYADYVSAGFTLIERFYIYSASQGVLIDEVYETVYVGFSNASGGYSFPVPVDGYATIVNEILDNGGGLHSSSTVTFDCTTGEISLENNSIYGPKVPTGFELRSLSGSSAVLDAPGGEQVSDNAVYAGQSWYVNPTPVAGPDGKNYTEIFVGGYTTGFIPTDCIQ